MEEKRLSRSDRLLNPIVKRIPFWIKPNHLSSARIPATLFVVISLAIGWNVLGVLSLCLAVVFDLLDGPLARWRGEQSKLGEVLDPCADKVMILSVLLTFGWGYFPAVLIIATASIEVLLVFGRWVKIRLGKEAKSNDWGKRKMWFQSAAVIGLAVHTDWTISVANVALWIALGLAGLSVAFHVRDLFARSK